MCYRRFLAPRAIVARVRNPRRKAGVRCVRVAAGASTWCGAHVSRPRGEKNISHAMSRYRTSGVSRSCSTRTLSGRRGSRRQGPHNGKAGPAHAQQSAAKPPLPAIPPPPAFIPIPAYTTDLPHSRCGTAAALAARALHDPSIVTSSVSIPMVLKRLYNGPHLSSPAHRHFSTRDSAGPRRQLHAARRRVALLMPM